MSLCGVASSERTAEVWLALDVPSWGIACELPNPRLSFLRRRTDMSRASSTALGSTLEAHFTYGVPLERTSRLVKRHDDGYQKAMTGTGSLFRFRGHCITHCLQRRIRSVHGETCGAAVERLERWKTRPQEQATPRIGPCSVARRFTSFLFFSYPALSHSAQSSSLRAEALAILASSSADFCLLHPDRPRPALLKWLYLFLFAASVILQWKPFPPDCPLPFRALVIM